jgi:hypothetical protein
LPVNQSIVARPHQQPAANDRRKCVNKRSVDRIPIKSMPPRTLITSPSLPVIGYARLSTVRKKRLFQGLQNILVKMVKLWKARSRCTGDEESESTKQKTTSLCEKC